MDRERFGLISSLFERVVDLPAEQRSSILDRECSEDPELRAEVEKLLHQDDAVEGDNAFDVVQGDLGRQAAGVLQTQQRRDVPERIGRYRILDELGRGGMGVVYRAQQEQPRRVVALKLIRAAVMDERRVRRFEHEAEVLGRLHHPGIAQIFEAGTAGEGETLEPFFAMELVEGTSLTRHAQDRRLGVAERVRLLIATCEAVHHAHQKGVVHRDLKPANILVTDAGEVKILDFGVARATDAEGVLTTMQTDHRPLVGTLPYMSPEQVSPEDEDVDTRSDVYSLGVVAYELLSGRLPVDVAEFSLPRAVARIREREPAPLGSVQRALKGDLETIVAKALEKDRARRYQSALDLGADLRRSLEHEPIEARPPSTFYQLEKLARRHTGLVVGLCIAAVVLVAGIVGMMGVTFEARRAEQAARLAEDKARRAEETAQDAAASAERQREAADRRAQVAAAVNDFIDRMLSAPNPFDPDFAGSRDVRVRDVLDQAAAELDAGFDGLPDVEAELRGILGRTYLDLGAFGRARPQLERCRDLRLELQGAQARPTLTAERSLLEVLNRQGAAAEAVSPAAEVVARHEQALGAEEIETLDARLKYAEILFALNRLEEAELQARQAFEIAREVYGEEESIALRAMGVLGVCLLNLGELEEAEEIQRELIDLLVWVRGEEHLETLSARSNLAGTLWRQDRREEAEEQAQLVLDLRLDVIGEEHPKTLNAMNSVIVFMNARHAHREANSLRERQLAAARRSLGAEHPLTLSFEHNHARALHLQRDLDEAERRARRVLEARRRVLPPGHESTLQTMEVLGLLLGDCGGRDDEAERLMREAHELAETHLPENHWMRPWLRAQWGARLVALGRDDEAEPVLLEACAELERRFGAFHSRTRSAQAFLARIEGSGGGR